MRKQEGEEGKVGTSRDLPSQLLLRYTDTNTGGTVKKSTTEFTSSQNHSLSFAAINWEQKVRKRGHHANIRQNMNLMSKIKQMERKMVLMSRNTYTQTKVE